MQWPLRSLRGSARDTRLRDQATDSIAAVLALRTGRLDATRAEIAWRLADSDKWTVTHARKSDRLPGPFAL